MNLIALMQGFMGAKENKLCEELAEKYGVPMDEVAGVVESFLKDTYGPAEKLIWSIKCQDRPVLLFIGRSDCAICQRCKPDLEKFLLDHDNLEGVLLDYSKPEGLLYHVIQQKDEGLLPLIAMIVHGTIMMIFTGKYISYEIYEKYYKDIEIELSQNI